MNINRHNSSNKKILLVDDMRLFLEMEKTFLNRSNFTIFTVLSGEEALEIHRREKVDLILLDLYMPGMRGDEVCKKIRADNDLKYVSIIMVTSSSKPDDIEICLRAGANDYINKPIKPMELLSKIGKLLNIPERKELRTPLEVKIEGKDKEVPFLGNTINISMTGILMETNRVLGVGDNLEISLVLPGKPFPIELKGSIVRREIGAKEGGVRYGIRFVDLDWEERKLLKDFLAQKRQV